MTSFEQINLFKQIHGEEKNSLVNLTAISTKLQSFCLDLICEIVKLCSKTSKISEWRLYLDCTVNQLLNKRSFSFVSTAGTI